MTERARFQAWVDGQAIPAGYDARFLDRVRRRRRVRAARTAALAVTTAACLAVGATLVPWPQPSGDRGTPPALSTLSTVPSPAAACGFTTAGSPAAAGGLALTVRLPARERSGTRLRIAAVLTNTGDRPVTAEVVGEVRICTVRTDDGVVGVSGMVGPNPSERSFTLDPGRSTEYDYPWIGNICPKDQAGREVCNPGGGLIATGVYRAYATLELRHGGVVSHLGTASAGTIRIVD